MSLGKYVRCRIRAKRAAEPFVARLQSVRVCMPLETQLVKVQGTLAACTSEVQERFRQSMHSPLEQPEEQLGHQLKIWRAEVFHRDQLLAPQCAHALAEACTGAAVSI